MNSEDQKKTSPGTEMTDHMTDHEGLVDQAKHVMSVVADKVGEEVNHQLDAQRDTAVKKIGGVAQAIRWGSGLLKDVGPLGDVSTKAADGIEGVASFFEKKQVGDVIRDVERFARREPAIFLGAALAVGLIGGRFLKSSTSHDAEGAEADGYDDDVPMRSYSAERDRDFGYGEGGYLRSDDLEDYESRRDGMPRGTSATRTSPMTARTGSSSFASRPAARPTPPRPPQTSTPATAGSIKPSPIVNASSSTGGSVGPGGSVSTGGKSTAQMAPVDRSQSQAAATTPGPVGPNGLSNGLAGR